VSWCARAERSINALGVWGATQNIAKALEFVEDASNDIISTGQRLRQSLNIIFNGTSNRNSS
jgi:hypothetical protein